MRLSAFESIPRDGHGYEHGYAAATTICCSSFFELGAAFCDCHVLPFHDGSAPADAPPPMRDSERLLIMLFLEFPALPAARVDTTNNNTDWTKTKPSHASLVRDTGLTNGRHAKRHATLPPPASAMRPPRLRTICSVSSRVTPSLMDCATHPAA